MYVLHLQVLIGSNVALDLSHWSHNVARLESLKLLSRLHAVVARW